MDKKEEEQNIDVIVADNFKEAFLKTGILLSTKRKVVIGATEKNLSKVLQIRGIFKEFGIVEKTRFEYKVGDLKAIAIVLENDKSYD